MMVQISRSYFKNCGTPLLFQPVMYYLSPFLVIESGSYIFRVFFLLNFILYCSQLYTFYREPCHCVKYKVFSWIRVLGG